APKPLEARDTIREDAAWVARVRDGDEDAAQALIQRLYPTILKVVRSHLPRRSVVDDLVQAVCIKVFRNLHQFSCQRPLEHWVSRIAVNTCLNQLKYETARPELRMSDLTEEQEAVVQQLACTTDELSADQSRAARELLARLMSYLNPSERLVITL